MKQLLFFLLLISTTLHSQTRYPFGRKHKNIKTITLTNGKYDEFFDEDTLQRIGSSLININTKKITKIKLSQEEIDELENAQASRFLSVDPLTNKYPELTPYQFASNTPVWAIDLDGLEGCIASPLGTSNIIRNGKAEPDPAFQMGRNAATFFSQPAAYWQKLAYANFMNGTYNTDVYTPEYYKDLTQGEYYGGMMGQSYLKHSSSTISHNAPLRKGSNQTEIQLNSASKNSKVPEQNQAAASNSNLRNLKNGNIETGTPTAGDQAGLIVAVKTTPQTDGSFGSRSFSLDNGKINLTSRSVTNGTFDFVVTTNGTLVIGNGHYNLSGGASVVKAAGQISLYRGKVTNINNSSGHYQPSVEQGKKFGQTLKEAGVDVNGANLNLYNKEGEKAMPSIKL